MKPRVRNIVPTFERILIVLAFGLLLTSVLPETYFEINGVEMEEYDEREKEADEEKKHHSIKDQLNNIFCWGDDLTQALLSKLSFRGNLSSSYKDFYFGVITPPPEYIPFMGEQLLQFISRFNS